MSSVRPVDVTTDRTTPRLALAVIPSSTGVNLNGGVLRMFSSWWRLPFAATPNRWLSVSRPVGPSSSMTGGLPRFWGLPPPRAQENVEEKAQIPRPSTPAEMGRSTDADGERECARASPPDSLHRPLDIRCFIDGLVLHPAGDMFPRRSRCSVRYIRDCDRVPRCEARLSLGERSGEKQFQTVVEMVRPLPAAIFDQPV